MGSVHEPALLPRNAPFDDEARRALDGALAAATATQRAWLAGFLAGLDARAEGTAAVPAKPPRAATPLTILYATEGGNAERLALDTARAAKAAGMRPVTLDMADLDLAALPRAANLVVIASTWGEGEPPARATRNYAALMADAAPRLDGVRFAVLALGDTAYAQYCETGRALDRRLEALGAKRIAERIECDLDYADPAAIWIEGVVRAFAPPAVVTDNVVQVAFGRDRDTHAELAAEIVAHVNLNSSRSDKETVHLALDLGPDAAWTPGDSLDLFPENDPALVEDIVGLVGLVGLTGDTALRQRLITERDITTLTPAALDAYAAATGLALPDDPRTWVRGRQLVDLIAHAPAPLSADALLALTRPLPPRAYSIASAMAETGSEAHLLVAAVRYAAHGRARGGVASTWVADRLRTGTTIRARLRPNRHFRLPADPATDIVMVGPGTGIAPFRAFVQARRAAGARGRNWLFYGDRRFTHDFLYQLEWQAALADGSLARLDLAFSRDQPAKHYVQHALWDARADLVRWLDGGASFYVCGDATAMAKDVRAMLVSAFAAVTGGDGEAAVTALETEKRYLTDTY